MKLYSAPPSPYSRKVKMVLHETGQLADVAIIVASGTPIDPGSMPLAANPLGKIPTLQRPDGPALYDSRVICRYLDSRVSGILYPQDDSLWDILTLEATADGILDSAIAIVYEKRVRPENMQYSVWLDAQWQKIERTVTVLNDRWLAHLNGPLNIGQIAVCCALGYLDFRMPDQNWRTGADDLSHWYNQFLLRKSAVATVPTD